MISVIYICSMYNPNVQDVRRLRVIARWEHRGLPDGPDGRHPGALPAARARHLQEPGHAARRVLRHVLGARDQLAGELVDPRAKAGRRARAHAYGPHRRPRLYGDLRKGARCTTLSPRQYLRQFD